MRHERLSHFERDFVDLHGGRPVPAITVQIGANPSPVTWRGVERPWVRLAWGVAGLFWVLVLGGLLVAGVGALAIALWPF
jgi:hypothetical protein